MSLRFLLRCLLIGRCGHFVSQVVAFVVCRAIEWSRGTSLGVDSKGDHCGGRHGGHTMRDPYPTPAVMARGLETKLWTLGREILFLILETTEDI